MKKPEEAMSRVQSQLQKDPQNIGLMAEVSRIYMIIGKKKEAIENANRMIDRKPDVPAGYLMLALVYQNQQQIDSAIEVLKRAAGLNDRNVNMMLGGLYQAKRDFKNALDIYRSVEKRNPSYAPAIYQQGAVYHAMGKVREASIQYSRALKVSGNFLPALNNLAYIYAEEGRDLDKAMQYAARAYVLAPNDGSVLDTFGFVLLKNKKNKDALQVLKKASDRMPANPTVLYHLALAYRENADKAQAVSSLQKAIQIGKFPDEKNARILLAKLQKG